MNSSSNKQKGIIEKQVKRKLREEKDKQSKVTHIIIKGLRDFGEKERTDILTRDFLKDKLNWTGNIQQANRIGKKVDGGKDRHVRVILRNLEDKNRILKNRGLLRGTHIYLDEDLTFEQQEEQRKEWEKVKKAKNEAKWTWLKNEKAQISDQFSNKK